MTGATALLGNPDGVVVCLRNRAQHSTTHNMGQHVEGGGGRGFAGGRGATVPFTDLTLTLINPK